jgi:hypothetical protein
MGSLLVAGTGAGRVAGLPHVDGRSLAGQAFWSGFNELKPRVGLPFLQRPSEDFHRSTRT